MARGQPNSHRGGRGLYGRGNSQSGRAFPANYGSMGDTESDPDDRQLATPRRGTHVNVGRNAGRGYHNPTINQSSRASIPLINSPASPSPYNQGHDRQSHNAPYTHNFPMLRGAEQGWASEQEGKVKVMNLPPGCWTQDVYRELCKFGNVVRVEIKAENACAWVTFIPPPHFSIFKAPIIIDSVIVRTEPSPLRLNFVTSPIDPKKIYPEMNILFANRIEFGITLFDRTIDVMQTVESYQDLRVSLNLRDRKELDFQFPLMIDGMKRRIRFRLPLSLIPVIERVDDKETKQSHLIIPFQSPPQFWMQADEKSIAQTFNPKEKTWGDWFSWYRQTDIADNDAITRMKSNPVTSLKDAAIIDFGRWTTYRLSFNSSALEGVKYKDFHDALADHGIIVKELETYAVRKGWRSPLCRLLEDEISGTHPNLKQARTQESAFEELIGGQVNLSFAVRYQLEACLSDGCLKEHAMTRNFLQRLATMDPDRAAYLLEKVSDKQRDHVNPMDIFDMPLKARLTNTIPNYCSLSRSASITPSMIHVGQPVVETSNRIIRKHAADADRFIRVKFTDERTEGPIYSQYDNRSDAVFDRIRQAMNNGIVVAGRYYEFLAFGNSQFREHGAYFYAPTASKSADDIRRSMGQFDHIKTAAKFGARLGQCFSTTRAIKSINVKIVMVEDIERNGYTFTDGVGRISPLLAQMAAKELGLHDPFDDPPSLFQFRLGGCKGVLALDPKLTGSVVHIRPSQYKFEATNVGLEVIRASALAVANFNRQLIIILSNLGVSDLVFIQKQQEMVNYLERATKEEDIALEKLQRNIDFNQTTLTMAAMVLDGFMKTKDPFMMSLLQLWRAFHIKYLKEKARIVVEDGAFVLGCVDETATLRGHTDDPQSRPDATRTEKIASLPEIFLRISDHAKKGQYRVIEGVCLLARNPSLHGGDVRVVRAVNVPALHHLKNVVVLPQSGDRDIANMCSGGDLDGDDYIVLWDHELIPAIVNEPPMDFTPEKPVQSDEPITVQDITDFFVTYMKHDTLRQIATSHLAQADFNADGVRSETCLELAELHSQAVDYPKNGIPAQMRRELRPRGWPHFQESKHRAAHQVYKSKKVLGMLYDQVELVDFKPQYENAFDSRILNAFPLDTVILEEAKDIKASYDFALRRLMAKHAIRTEFEAWSIFVLSHNLETRDYSFSEEFGRTIGVLKAQFRDTCRKAAGASGTSDAAKLAPFVVAMYTVTAQEVETALKECRSTKVVSGETVPARPMDPEHMPLMSFPWLFNNELGRIANGVISADSADVRQILPYQNRKGKDATLSPAPKLGGIETLQGVTQYGEVLKLDFPETTTNKSLNSEPGLKNAPNGKSEAEGDSAALPLPPLLPQFHPAPVPALNRQSSAAVLAPTLSPSPKVAPSYSWMKGNTQVAVGDITNTMSLQPPTASDDDDGKDQPKVRESEQQDQDETAFIEAQGKKASAMDRLARFW